MLWRILRVFLVIPAALLLAVMFLVLVVLGWVLPPLRGLADVIAGKTLPYLFRQ